MSTGPAAPAPALTSPAANAARRPSRLATTPSQLRFAMTLSVVAALLLGALGLGIGLLQSSRLGAVSERTGQTVDLLAARGDLVTADGTATNAFLIGGLEPASLRSEYDTALASGSRQLAAQADRSAQLASASADLTVYSGLIERARANNRQGFPVGAAYLDQASSGLGSDVLPAIDDVVVSTADDAASDLGALKLAVWGSLLLVAFLAVLALVQIWLARRTRRTFNVPMLVGSGLAVLAVVAGMGIFSATAGAANNVRHGSYTATLGVSQALSLAGEARSDESFTLIRRGSGAAYEQQFLTATKEATHQLNRAATASGGGSDLKTKFDAWLTAHAKIRQLDDSGNWDGAVALATSRAADSPSSAYEAFVAAARKELKAQSAATDHGLSKGSVRTAVAGWLLALAGVAAAVGSWRGLDRRLEEYR